MLPLKSLQGRKERAHARRGADGCSPLWPEGVRRAPLPRSEGQLCHYAPVRRAPRKGTVGYARASCASHAAAALSQTRTCQHASGTFQHALMTILAYQLTPARKQVHSSTILRAGGHIQYAREYAPGHSCMLKTHIPTHSNNKRTHSGAEARTFQRAWEHLPLRRCELSPRGHHRHVRRCRRIMPDARGHPRVQHALICAPRPLFKKFSSRIW